MFQTLNWIIEARYQPDEPTVTKQPSDFWGENPAINLKIHVFASGHYKMPDIIIKTTTKQYIYFYIMYFICFCSRLCLLFHLKLNIGIRQIHSEYYSLTCK